ncbi:hypothetical protein [Acidipropionibacterium timonense]|uniref:hypothetical protein n=1 Tax=Acidipropionibacterium timonense TaxID=2161818 RepID=UPI001030D792|nr:hypothetical protein [Acidipropionibacterium timonense]
MGFGNVKDAKFGSKTSGKSTTKKARGDEFHPKAADPFAEVEYTGSVQEDAKRELSAMEQAYRSRATQEERRRRYATDSEHWVAICFCTREDKEAWIEQVVGDLSLGDKYINGYKLCKVMGVDLGSDE